jgi:CubicO group peptidase (beta-lactamase class C family)
VRIFLLLLCLFAMTALNTAASAADETPKSELMSDKVAKRKIGEQVLNLMKKHDIPGGQVCIVKKGHIVYMGAFGYADRELTVPVSHDNLFRIASISKVITSVAIWQLIEREKLSPGDKAFDILSDLKPKEDAVCDSRLSGITISNLLEHTAGFGCTKGDPQFIYQRAAADAFGEKPPCSGTAIIRLATGDPLEYDPGSKSLYSNLGFNILGRVIERVSGKSYEDFVKENVLFPAAIHDMELGKTRVKQQLPREVWYWQGQDQYDGWSIIGEEPLMVPRPYGSEFAIEPFDAHGGWIASARDVACLGSAIDGHPVDADAQTLLQAKTLERMLTPSSFALNNGAFRGEGVPVVPTKRIWEHTGGMCGTSAFLISYKGEIVLSAVFNRLPTPREAEFFDRLDSLLNSLAREFY